jgi:hypothetical protein
MPHWSNKTATKRWIAISCAVIAICSCATQSSVDNDQEPSFEIINFGLYRPVEINGLDNIENATGADTVNGELYTLKQRTDEIPIIPYTRFGFEWCAENYPQGIHRLYLVLEHPSKNNAVKSKYVTKRIYRRSKVGDKKTIMCSTETWEMNETNLLIGDIWTLGIWDENQPLITRDFRFITEADYFKPLK